VKCWLWTGTRRPDGYGVVKHAGRLWRVHRLAYEVFVGPIPPGQCVHHRCGVRACINPNHLALMSGAAHGRHHKPRHTHCPKGHAYVLLGSGHQACLVCRAARKRARYARKGA
jgi:hypothetical protein